MEGHPVLPGLERFAAGQGRQTFDRTRLPDDERRLLLESGGTQVGIPFEPRRVRRKLGDAPRIVRLVNVFARRAVEMRGSDFGFKRHDPFRFRGGLAYASKFQQVTNVGLVGSAMFCHLRLIRDVILPVGQAETALQEVWNSVRGIAQRLRDKEAEQILGPEVGRVQRIDVGAKILAKRAGEVGFRFDSRDPAEPLLERSEAALLDAGRVHVGRVVVGDQSLRRVRARFAGACFADQVCVALLRFLKDLEIHARARPIAWNFSLLAPGAIRIFLEVVARFYGEIAQSEIDPDRLFRPWRSGERRRRHEQNECERSKDLHLHAVRVDVRAQCCNRDNFPAK